MFTDFLNGICGDCASAYCDIRLMCSGISVYGDGSKDRGGLSMVPGAVVDDSGLWCFCPARDIDINSCADDIAQTTWIRPEALEQTICRGFIEGNVQEADADSRDTDCIWTSTEQHSSESAVHLGDTLTYTVTFTNHSATVLDMVRISGDIPQGVTLEPYSIKPAPQPGETLGTGISVGSVRPGRAVELTYDVIVLESDDIVSSASAVFDFSDCRGCVQRGIGGRRSDVVKVYTKCICKHADRRYTLRGFDVFRDCSISYTGAAIHSSLLLGRSLKARYTLELNYFDRAGQELTASFEGAVNFGIPGDFDDVHFAVRLVGLRCCSDRRGRVAAGFNAELCYLLRE